MTYLYYFQNELQIFKHKIYFYRRMTLQLKLEVLSRNSELTEGER